MKRKWYSASNGLQNKNTSVDVQSTRQESDKIEALQTWYTNRIKKLPMNIIEFFIWVWLLLFSRSYIQNNPAERLSLFNWIESVMQNIQIKYLQRTRWTWSEILQQRQLVQTFDSIISTAENFVWCLEERDISRIRRARDSLQALTVEEFTVQQQSYTTVANIYYTKIQEECIIHN